LIGELYLQLGPEKCLELQNKPGDATPSAKKGRARHDGAGDEQAARRRAELKPRLKAGN